MDSDNTQSQSQSQSSAARSAEEVAWDEEFKSTSKSDDSLTGTLSDLARLVVQVPTALVEVSSFMFPEETRKHARAAVRESFLTVRSLLGAVGDGIESLLAEPAGGEGKQKPPVSGPAGTWGHARQAGTRGMGGGATSAKVTRIEVSDGAEGGASNIGAESTHPGSIPADETNVPEDRGLRADIDY